MSRMSPWRWLLPVLPLSASSAFAATELDRAVQDSLSQTLTTVTLLTNGEALRFGIWNFDTDTLFNLNEEDRPTDAAESGDIRQSLSMFSLPVSWTLPLNNSDDSVILRAQLAYFDIDQDTQLVPSDEPADDDIRDTVISASLGAAWRHPVTDKLSLTLGNQVYWLHYRNRTRFNTAASQAFQPVLDGLITNIELDAVLDEPTVTLRYDTFARGSQWQFFTDYHYLRGRTVSVDRTAHEADPEAWFWSNGFRLKNPLVSRVLPGQNIWLRAARVDVGGDIGESLGGGHYYEGGIAWLLDTGGRVPFLDNIGIGININFGSVLQGGTLIFLYNER